MASIPIIKFSPKLLPTTNVQQQYTPPNWGKAKQLYAITFRSITSELQSTVTINPDGSANYVKDNASVQAGFNATTQMNMFVFDAIRRAEHRLNATPTRHPLQTGFNVSDHLIMQPSQVTLEVAMSDAIASYSVAGYTPMWQMNPSKSVSAFQQVEQLMRNRQLMTLSTRLETYDNMVITDVSVEDTERTYFGGLAMVINFQQLIVADASLSYDSARVQASGDTQKGAVQPQPPSKTVTDQHKILHNPFANQNVITTIGGIIPQINIPGAGDWTSNIASGIKEWWAKIGAF